MSAVFISGASRGLGLEWSRQLAARGESVIGTVRTPAEAARLPAGVDCLQLDVESPVSVAALAQRFAGASIDVLINNAGVGEAAISEDRTGRKLEQLDFDAVQRTLAINTLGPMRVLAALLPALRRGRGRRVIMISSELGSLAQNTSGGWISYRISKAALNMYTRSAAVELAPEGFVCVAMHPGWVRTDMGGSEAPLSPPESVAGMIQVLDRLTPADNGRFLAWNGQELPW